MIGVALAAIALAIIEFLVWARLLSRERRAREREAQQWAAERELLIDKVLHAADKTWTPPPRLEPEPPREREPDEDLVNW